jgi:tol-pal system protein YbgF
MTEEPKIGAPGGREAGEPLDLSTLSAAAASGPGPTKSMSDSGPAPQVREPGPAGGQVAAIPPPQSSRDEFDLAYGYVLAKDYLKAEAGMRAFVAKYPSDRLAPEAQFWLGESMFQRQSYRDAAEAFLAMSKKYDGHAKAPDALLRLGQSLAALKEKELACATFGEVGRKYPRAGANLKQAVEREQKRVRC